MSFKNIWMIIALSFISIANAYSASTTYTYDELHRLSSVTQENCTSTTYTYDEAGNRTVKEVTQIDTTPPETSCTLDGTAGSNSWYTSNVTATLSATDTDCGISSTLYSTDNGSKWQTIKKPFKVMFTDEGEKELLFKSSDYGSNNEGQKSEIVKIDKTAPDISISSPSIGGKYSVKDNISLTVVITDGISGIDSKTVTLDGNTDVTVKSSLGTLSGGTHKIDVTAKDKAGNTSTKTMSFSVEGSSSAPSADAGSDQTVNEGATVALDGTNSSDTDGSIASYLWTQTGGTSVTLSDGASSQPTFTAPSVTTSVEVLTFELTVTDDGGLQDTDSVIVNVKDSVNQTKMPDLIGKMIYLNQTCKKKKKGTKCTIKGKVKITNVGDKKAGHSFVKLFLSDDASYGNEDTLIRQVKCRKIKKGKKLKRYFKYKFPLNSNATGKYVIAVVDYKEKVEESDETNNEVVFGPVE